MKETVRTDKLSADRHPRWVSPPGTAPSGHAKSVKRSNGLVGFATFHLGLQLMLLMPGLASVRALVRIGGFGVSLLFLVFVPNRATTRAPVKVWCTAILAIVLLEALHPNSAGGVAVLAQITLYVAILGPVFWVPRFAVTPRAFQSLLLMLWLYYSAGAVLGVLQAYFPGRFQPELSSVVAETGKGYAASLQIKLTSGEHVFRPMGLTNVPGGAAYGALFAILLGTGVILLPISPFFGARLAAIGSMLVGAMCLYLCQIRSMVVMTAICILVMLGLLAASGRVSRLLAMVASVGVVIPVAFTLAVSLAGSTVTDRLATLVASDAGTVYYKNRGRFLDSTINDLLPQYPLGAGLGHWGMVTRYFGSGGAYFWVEIQWTAWVLDGGLPLVLVYLIALLITTWSCLQITRGRYGRSEESLRVWGSVVVAYNVGAIALCFNYVPFIGTAGLEFWLVNAALVAAATNLDMLAKPLYVAAPIPQRV